jgi:hypothetical protein
MYGVHCLFACHVWEVLSTLTYKTPEPDAVGQIHAMTILHSEKH